MFIQGFKRRLFNYLPGAWAYRAASATVAPTVLYHALDPYRSTATAQLVAGAATLILADGEAEMQIVTAEAETLGGR